MCVQGWFGIYCEDGSGTTSLMWSICGSYDIRNRCASSVQHVSPFSPQNHVRPAEWLWNHAVMLEKYFHFLYCSCEIHHWIYLIDPGHKSMHSVLRYECVFVCVFAHRMMCVNTEGTCDLKHSFAYSGQSEKHQSSFATMPSATGGKNGHGRGRYTIIPMDLCVTHLMATRAYLHTYRQTCGNFADTSVLITLARCARQRRCGNGCRHNYDWNLMLDEN